MKIYNTLRRQKEEFVPLEEGKVKIYVCGPTVYNLIHIGNARPMIVFDTFRRYLEYKGYEVSYVSNFTDVDDKIIKASLEEGLPASEISERYIAECKKDMEAVNVRPATVHPQATQEIPSMIEMISNLIDKDFAYPVEDGTVYYKTKAFHDYGKLSHKNIDDLEGGHREIQVTGDLKRDPLDFVLWKPKKEGEPYWESPWCKGRPGWHIECSCMSKRYLGETIDIHAGGEDLIFPHHENEIAQSEASNGVEFARYWMHNGFLKINSVKMSKSQGNFLTVREICKRHSGQILRFFMLSAHYRSSLNYSEEQMEIAKNSLERILNTGKNLRYLQQHANTCDMRDYELACFEESQRFVLKFEDAMDDDCNSADALAAIFELVKFINSSVNENSSKALLQAFYDRLNRLMDVCGLILEQEEEDLDQKVEDLIEERQKARKQRDFARADQIRDQLLAEGIVLEDTREGVKWHRA